MPFHIGFRKGRLEVIGRPMTIRELNHRKKDGRVYYRNRSWYPCKCDCGNTKLVSDSQLIDPRIQSCGCAKQEMYVARRKHNTSYRSWNTPLFNVWRGMIRRCHSPNASNRKYYYDRGIEVCLEWREDFSAFEKWAKENGYERGLQIDRIDVNGNYEPSNCRWMTPRGNSHNRRNHIEITYKGEKRKLVDVMDEVGCSIDEHTVWKRIFLHKWDIERALTEAKHYIGRRGKIVLEYKGKKITTKDIANMTGLAPSAIRNRLFKQGMPIEQVISEPPKTHRKKRKDYTSNEDSNHF